MAPIRKGDGTPLEIPGVSEVRSGDGRVFFEGDAIPDAAVGQFDGTQLNLTDQDPVDPWTDEIGDFGDIVAGSAPTYLDSGLNNKGSVDFSGDDRLENENLTTNLTAPFSFIFALDLNAVEDSRYISQNDFGGDEDLIIFRNVGGDYSLVTPTDELRGEEVTEDEQILTIIVDGPDSKVRKNGTEILSDTDLGNPTLEVISVGGRRDGAEFLTATVGEIVPYNGNIEADGILQDEETRFSEKWGIALS